MQRSTNEKLLYGLVALHSALGGPWVWWLTANLALPKSLLAQNLLLAAFGLAGSLGALRGRRWGLPIVLCFYALQIVQIFAPAFVFAFSLGVGFNLSVGWNGGLELGVNVLALAMLAWAIVTAFAPNNSSKPTPLRGAA